MQSFMEPGFQPGQRSDDAAIRRQSSQLHGILWPLLGLTACLLVAACGSRERAVNPPLTITGTRLENRTSMWLSAVRVIVPATGNFVSCGNIAAGGQCSTTFPELAFTGNPVEVTWSQGGQIWSTGPLELQPDASVLEAGRALVQVVIVGAGSAGVVLLPDQGPQAP